MTTFLLVIICTGILRTYVQACDSEDLVQDLYNATLQNNCFQNSTSCVSSCISGHVLKDGNQTTNHVCNGTSWTPSTVICLPVQLPEMRTNLTIVYETGDLPAGSCLYSFNVTLTQYMDSFRDKLESTCNLLDTGGITIESLRLSALAFQITSIFGIKFSGSGTASSRKTCMDMVEIISSNDQNYLKPFSSVSCGDHYSVVSKRNTTRSRPFEYDCSERIGSQLLQTSGGFSCVPCFPGTYWNLSRCEPCPTGTYQTMTGQLNCDVCSTGKHVTEDKTQCQDSACVSAFLSRTVTGTDLTCISESQVCISTCTDGYIQDNGGSSTTYNCSEINLPPVVKTCQKYEFSTYMTKFDAVYQTQDQLASTCLSHFRSLTSAHWASFQTSLSTSCSLHSSGNVTIHNITSSSLTFQIKSTFHLAFYGSWPVKSINTCMNFIVIAFESSKASGFLHPYSTLQCTGGQTNVTKQTATRGTGDVIECSQGRQIINTTETSYCVPCVPGSFLAESVCRPCPNGTYQSLLGQTFCNNCSDRGTVNADNTGCILDEMTTTANNGSTPSTEVTSPNNGTEQPTPESTTAGTFETTQDTMTSTTTDSQTTLPPSTTSDSVSENSSKTTQQIVTSATTESSTPVDVTTTLSEIRTTEGYSIPCSVEQLSIAIPSATHECAIHNHTCVVECSPGFVTNTGETTVVYTCEGDLWTPQRKRCLEYEVPMSTSSLSLIYQTRDQLAAACLQKFQETSEANYDRFKRSIVDTCGQLGVTASNLKIENITSISLAFQITSKILLTFVGEGALKARETCLNILDIIFTTNSTFLHPYTPLTCTSGVSIVSKVSASHVTSIYNCGNTTSLVQHADNVFCVPCPPGMYMGSSQCAPCPGGYYQSLPGQTACALCPDNKIVVDGGTNCTDLVTTTPANTKLGKSQAAELSATDTIIVAVVSACLFVFIVIVATVYYCKKSKSKRRTSHVDTEETKSSGGMSIQSDEYLRRSQERMIPEPKRSKGDPDWSYSDKKIEKSTFASENETKALDVLKTIININIDNDECITSEPQVANMDERGGKWRRLRAKDDQSVSEGVLDKTEETVTQEAPARSLSDYDNFQIYVPEFQDPE